MFKTANKIDQKSKELGSIGSVFLHNPVKTESAPLVQPDAAMPVLKTGWLIMLLDA